MQSRTAARLTAGELLKQRKGLRIPKAYRNHIRFALTAPQTALVGRRNHAVSPQAFNEFRHRNLCIFKGYVVFLLQPCDDLRRADWFSQQIDDHGTRPSCPEIYPSIYMQEVSLAIHIRAHDPGQEGNTENISCGLIHCAGRVQLQFKLQILQPDTKCLILS